MAPVGSIPTRSRHYPAASPLPPRRAHRRAGGPYPSQRHPGGQLPATRCLRMVERRSETLGDKWVPKEPVGGSPTLKLERRC